MSALDALLDIEHDTGTKEQPLFFVQPPDGRRNWPEDRRQTVLFRELRLWANGVDGFHIPNAGKQNPMKALASGKKAGPFDCEFSWGNRGIAWVELKGYTADGRAGALSPEQIRWGNIKTRQGFDVACFFDPMAAIEWLRSLGAPVG